MPLPGSIGFRDWSDFYIKTSGLDFDDKKSSVFFAPDFLGFCLFEDNPIQRKRGDRIAISPRLTVLNRSNAEYKNIFFKR